MSAALGSPYAVSGAAHLPAEAAASIPALARFGGAVTLARIEDFAPSVAYRMGRLRADLQPFGHAEMLDDEDTRAVWAGVRDAMPIAAETGAIWRVSVRPSAGPGVVAALPPSRWFMDWGGGLIWIAGPANEATHAAVAAAARAAGGIWTLVRGPDVLRAARRCAAAGTGGAGAHSRAGEGRVRSEIHSQSRPHVRGRLGRSMQTFFTPEQLADPEISSSNEVLRTCVHCGMCTATCPTFVLLGDELDSPRGRIYLIKDMLESGRPATEEVVRHVDRCLSCLACMTTCPSGVNYMHLVDHARVRIEETYRRPWHDRAMRAMLSAVLPRPMLLRLALIGAGLARPFARLLPRRGMLAQRLHALLRLAPAAMPPPSPALREIHAALGPRRGRVALLAGCAQQVLDPEINAATIRLLTRMGVEVVVARGAGCCGALPHHMGRHDAAMDLARANIDAWTREMDGAGLDAVVVNTSGCGTTVKDYGFMFRAAEGDWPARAARVSAAALDISEYLTRLDYAPARPAPGLTVAYHSACSLQHGQGVTGEPKALLRCAGFTVVEPAEGHLCCGSAGTYNVLQPEIAERLRARKLANLQATKPDLVAAGNIGCMTQLSGGGLPVLHTVMLLDWMAGGPRPPGLPG